MAACKVQTRCTTDVGNNRSRDGRGGNPGRNRWCATTSLRFLQESWFHAVSKEPIPPGWELIPGLLKSFINTGSENVRIIENLLFAELCMAAVKYDTAQLKKRKWIIQILIKAVQYKMTTSLQYCTVYSAAFCFNPLYLRSPIFIFLIPSQ